jgi:hypothetical protein
MVIPQRGPTFVGAGLAAMAFLLIAVEAAHRTDSLARFAAEALHGEQQQNLFANRVGELEPAMIVKRNVDIVSGETDFALFRSTLRGLIDEIERLADRNGKAFQTAVAGTFDFAGQLAMEADLGRGWAVLRFARDMHGFGLEEFTRPEVERSWRDLEVELDFTKL